MLDTRVLALILACCSAVAVACTKTDTPPTPPEPTASATSSGSAPATASGAPTASATASTTAAASDAAPATSASASGSASAAASASASAPKKDAGGPATADAPCGKKPLPDCPLQAWMKANVNPPMAAGDNAGLAAALEKMAAFAPPGYANWVSISKDGAKAATSGDIAAAKASCRTCHDQYREKYRSEMRGRKI